jgi:hypothetical protein
MNKKPASSIPSRLEHPDLLMIVAHVKGMLGQGNREILAHAATAVG